MTPFVFLSWDVDQVAAEHVAHKFKTTLRAIRERWQILFDRPGALMAVKAGGRVSSRRCDGHPTFIVGDVFTADGLAPMAPSATEQSFEDLCGSLTTDCWGAYLALQIRDGGRFSLYRDPIGMRDSVCWTRSGVRVVASEPIPWLFLSAPSDLAIDWSCLAGLLGDSSTVFEVLPLTGIETVPTGTMVHFDSDQRRIRRLWQPSRFYGHEKRTTAAEFRETLISCVRAWLAAYPDTMLEISGGFDSALVAVAGTGIKRGVNFFSDGLAGDERRYARDVSTRSRIPLDEIHMPVGRLGEADVQDMPIGIRPGLGSTTLFHDRLLAHRAVAHGARAMLTGHGGDAVFFQHPTAEIAADPTFPRTDFRAHAALAKWSKESVWTVARHAFGISPKRARERRSDSSASLPLGMTPELKSQWVGELDGLPPAKRGQIYGIAGDRSAFGTSWRSQVLTVLHPLLSQPLVEQAIATDTYLLTRGRRDRSLARDAFRDLLPPSVAERRGKGSLGHFFGRSLAASTPFLRSFLLDGVLAQSHVFDRAKLEPMLDSDFLMQFDCYGKLLSTIVMEQWARVWEDRLRAMRSGDTAPADALQASPPANETHDRTGPEH